MLQQVTNLRTALYVGKDSTVKILIRAGRLKVKMCYRIGTARKALEEYNGIDIVVCGMGYLDLARELYKVRYLAPQKLWRKKLGVPHFCLDKTPENDRRLGWILRQDIAKPKLPRAA